MPYYWRRRKYINVSTSRTARTKFLDPSMSIHDSKHRLSDVVLLSCQNSILAKHKQSRFILLKMNIN